MEFVGFFRQRKNILLLVAIVAIVLGGVTLILATPFSFGPLITPSNGGALDADRYLAFIAFIAIMVALAEIILGVLLCITKYRERMAIVIPLLVLLSSELFLILVSIIIFGFAEISAFFYVIGILLIAGGLTGLLYNLFFLKEIDPEQARLNKEIKAREAEAKAAAKLEKKLEAELTKIGTPPTPPASPYDYGSVPDMPPPPLSSEEMI